MTIVVEQVKVNDLETPDFARLSRMHREFMTGSLVNWFGHEYVSSLYRYLVKSAHEAVFVARLEGRIIGACILSDKPASLSRRMLLNTSMVLHIPAAMLEMPIIHMLAASLRAARSRKKESGAEDHLIADLGKLPEVVWIYVDHDGRRKGIGRKLLSATESYLVTRHRSRYIIHTLAENNDDVIQFYKNSPNTIIFLFHWSGICIPIIHATN